MHKWEALIKRCMADVKLALSALEDAMSRMSDAATTCEQLYKTESRDEAIHVTKGRAEDAVKDVADRIHGASRAVMGRMKNSEKALDDLVKRVDVISSSILAQRERISWNDLLKLKRQRPSVRLPTTRVMEDDELSPLNRHSRHEKNAPLTLNFDKYDNVGIPIAVQTIRDKKHYRKSLAIPKTEDLFVGLAAVRSPPKKEEPKKESLSAQQVRTDAAKPPRSSHVGSQPQTMGGNVAMRNMEQGNVPENVDVNNPNKKGKESATESKPVVEKKQVVIPAPKIEKKPEVTQPKVEKNPEVIPPKVEKKPEVTAPKVENKPVVAPIPKKPEPKIEKKPEVIPPKVERKPIAPKRSEVAPERKVERKPEVTSPKTNVKGTSESPVVETRSNDPVSKEVTSQGTEQISGQPPSTAKDTNESTNKTPSQSDKKLPGAPVPRKAPLPPPPRRRTADEDARKRAQSMALAEAVVHATDGAPRRAPSKPPPPPARKGGIVPKAHVPPPPPRKAPLGPPKRPKQ